MSAVTAEAALTVAPPSVTVAIAAAAVTVMDLRNRVYQYNLIHSITKVYAEVIRGCSVSTSRVMYTGHVQEQQQQGP